MSEQKLSKEKKRQIERDTEATMANEMPWENIYSEIAKLKESKEVLLSDIKSLDGKRATVEGQIRHYQRIAGFKRKQAGA